MNLRDFNFFLPLGRLGGMMPLGNNQSALPAALLVVLMALFGTPRAHGQALPLTDATALEAQRLAEQWIQRASIPAEADEHREVEDLLGVRVTVRIDGIVLGRGDELRSDLDLFIHQPAPATDLIPLLQKAAADALNKSRDAIQRLNVKQQLKRGGRDVAPQRLEQVADQLSVDVQLAHRLEPIQVLADASPDEVFNHFAPGFHGLRMRAPGSGEASLAWPLTSYANRIGPDRMLRRLLTDQGLNDASLPRVARQDGPALQRFQTVSAVRGSLDQRAEVLVRGNTKLLPRTLDREGVTRLSDVIGGHIFNERVVFDGSVRGTYLPDRAEYVAQPDRTSKQAAALTAFALARQATVIKELQGPRPIREDNRIDLCANAAVSIVKRLVQQDEQRPMSLEAAALCVLTLTAIPNAAANPDINALRDAMLSRVTEAQQQSGRFFKPGSTTELNQPSSALLTAALAAGYRAAPSDALADAVSKALARLTQDAEIRDDLHALPWLMMAEYSAGPALAKLNDQQKADRAERIKLLRNFIDQLLDPRSNRQINSLPELGPDDVLGGFRLRSEPAGSPPNPDWNSAGPMLFLALALRDPEVLGQPQMRQGPLLSLGLGAAFLNRLTMQGPALFLAAFPKSAEGGVRDKLWNNEMPVAASAYVLLALTELQATLHQLQVEEDNAN